MLTTLQENILKKLTLKIGIKQIHGYRNERDSGDRPEDRHREFLSKWLSWVRSGSPRDSQGNPVTKEKERKTA